MRGIDIGVIVTVVLALVAGAVAYGKLDQKVETLISDKIPSINVELDTIESKAVANASGINILNGELSRTPDDLVSQLSSLRDVQSSNSNGLNSVVDRLNALEAKETISSVSVSLKKPISRVFGRTYTAESDGFVIATLETLGGNNYGVICGFLGDVGAGEDPTKSAQGASVFRTDEDGVPEAGAYLPLSSMTMVVNKGDRWTVKSCGNVLDDNFRSQVSWVSLSVETRK